MSKPFSLSLAASRAKAAIHLSETALSPAKPPILSLPDRREVPLVLRRSARARRYSLRVSRLDGAVTLTLPRFASEADGIAFAQSQADWLARQLAQISPVQRVTFGGLLPYEGRELTITPAALRAPRIEGEVVFVPQNPERLGGSLEAFLKLAARQRLQAASEAYAAQIARPIRRITLRDTRSRWGSCSHDGSLSYSWRLIMAPPAVLDYVAAHEVAHLAEMNHSPAFWAVVEHLRPSFRTERAWLKREGGRLQAIRFRD